MMADNSHYFVSDPDWASFAEKNGYALKSEPYEIPNIDLPSDRAAQNVSEATWVEAHPLKSVGYHSTESTVRARDGFEIPIKISRPVASRVTGDKKLPLLFVTHGGGWVQGTHITEEAWLLWPIYSDFDFVIVSVEYRLAPESASPTYIDDSWDVLTHVLARSDELHFDSDRVILTGSSAGGGVAAALSQIARAETIKIHAVLLNVPVLCDYRHFPKSEYPYTSYEQCGGAFLSSGEMRAIWDIVVPSPSAGSDPKISPFLGNVDGLPPHIIYVAGQDPLRDEAIAYAEKLDKAGVKMSTVVYQGVPHNFGEFWTLEATQRWWIDLRKHVREILEH
jgi:acetyl esterase